MLYVGVQEGSTDLSALGSLIKSRGTDRTPGGVSGNHSVVLNTFSASLDVDVFLLVLS